jgi:hypothetical protein
MAQALHGGVQSDATAGLTRPRIAGTGKVAVTVPHLARVYAFPGGAHQFVSGKLFGQGAAAGIDEALLGPVAPGGEPARAERERAREPKEFSARNTQNRIYAGESLI